MIIKQLTKASHMKQQDYINYIWNTFGIQIAEHGSYVGFVKAPGSYYEMFFPILEDNKITSFRHDCCKKVAVRTFGDCKRYIAKMGRNEVDQEYLLTLIKEMEEIRS